MEHPSASLARTRWKEIERLFAQALDVPPERREEFLAAACPDDEGLRREVRTLLSAHQMALAQSGDRERFLERLDAERAAALIQPSTITDLLALLQRTLGTTYQIERELGGGGMSRVFVADETALGRRVVIKVLPPDLAGSVSVERFQREVRLAAGLQHPHIVPLLSAGQADELLYYTMPLVEGESLRAKLTREGALPVHDCVRILRDVLDALAYAHSRGVAHRDIKPENVLLARRHALVTDFGVAKALTEASAETPLTSTGLILGTPAYMAPEQAAGDRHVDHRADIYAAGVLAYEMLAGCAPFVRATAQELLAAHVTQAPPPITAHRQHVPQALADAVMRCLEKHPADRWQTADELLGALEGLTAARADAATAAEAESSPLQGRLRNPRVVVAAVIVALAGAAVALAAAKVPKWWHDTTAAPVTAIAVLPFADLSAGRDQEYLSDGITEEILNALARIPGLRVPGRTTSFSFKGRNLPIPQIARELGVTHVLEGSVRTDRERLRITAQLVDARSDAHLWSETYDRAPGDIFAVQDEIARAIVRALRVRLRDARDATLVRQPTQDAEAYGLYLQGRYLWHARGAANLRRALGFYRQAIARDPGFARAYGAMAEAYMLLPPYTDARPDSAIASARAAARQALALDPETPEAHSALAVVSTGVANWEAAEREYRRAIEIDPTYAPARYQYCYHLMIVRRFAEAREQCRRSVELDSLSLTANLMLGQVLWHTRRSAEAVHQLRELLELEPHFGLARAFLAHYYAHSGSADSAVAEAERLLAQVDRSATLQLALVGNAFAVAGRPDRAAAILAELERRARAGEFVSPVATAYVRVALGQRDWAVRLVEDAVRGRAFYHDWLRLLAEPGFDSLRADPRFQAALARVALR